MLDVGPPLILTAIGLILWLAVDVALAGLSIQTIGIILFVVGVLWLVVSLFQDGAWLRGRRGTVVREREVL